MQKIQLITGVLLLLSGISYSWALDADQASAQVKNLPCKDNLTVEQVLDQSVRSHSQRDIGWRVKADNSITPQSDRAEKLCSSE
jgi:hypothetical protein